MQKKIIAAAGTLAVIGLGAGGAFTASNTFSSGSVAGYGEVSVTGATVTAITNTPVSTDLTKLDRVVFTTSNDVFGKTASMTLKSGISPATPTAFGTYGCIVTQATAPVTTITCSTTTVLAVGAFAAPVNPSLAAIDVTGLTVN
jgi:hypothetical protein